MLTHVFRILALLIYWAIAAGFCFYWYDHHTSDNDVVDTRFIAIITTILNIIPVIIVFPILAKMLCNLNFGLFFHYTVTGWYHVMNALTIGGIVVVGGFYAYAIIAHNRQCLAGARAQAEAARRKAELEAQLAEKQAAYEESISGLTFLDLSTVNPRSLEWARDFKLTTPTVILPPGVRQPTSLEQLAAQAFVSTSFNPRLENFPTPAPYPEGERAVKLGALISRILNVGDGGFMPDLPDRITVVYTHANDMWYRTLIPPYNARNVTDRIVPAIQEVTTGWEDYYILTGTTPNLDDSSRIESMKTLLNVMGQEDYRKRAS